MKSSPVNFPFASTYQTYKKNTDDIARFLDETAVAIGYKIKPPVADPAPQTQAAPPVLVAKKSKKQQKKAEKEKKKENVPKPPSQSQRQQHRIRVQEFVGIATAIRYKPPPQVSLPGWLLPALNATVELRKRAAVVFKTGGNGTAEQEESIVKHEYFIRVLETVRELLEPVTRMTTEAIAKVSGAAFQQKEQREAPAELENTLPEVEDVVEAFEEMEVNEAAIDLDELPPPELDVDDEDEEWDEETEEFFSEFFAVYCLFEDLNKVRKYVSEVWTKYKNGREDGTDLMAASMVTNAAIDLVRRLENNVLIDFPDLDSGPQMCEDQFRMICEARGVDPDDVEQPEDPYHFGDAKTADWLFYGAALEVADFFESLNEWEAATAFARRNEPNNRYDLSADRDAMDVRQKWQEDRLILRDILPEFTQLACIAIMAHDVKNLHLDEWSEGFVKTIDDGDLGLWLVFCAQLHLDITHILRERVADAYNELRTTAMIAKVSFSIALKEMRPSPNWLKQDNAAFSGIAHYIDDFILNDMTVSMKKDTTIDKRKPKPKPDDIDESFWLMKRHPLMCGTIKFALIVFLRYGGTKLSNAWGSIIDTAHLYNALRESGDLDIPWPDMERVIEMHTEEIVFYGKRPRSRRACAESYARMADLRLATGRLDWNKNNPVIQTFGDRYFSKNRVDWTVDSAEAIIQASIPGGRKNKRTRQSRDGTTVVALLSALRTAFAAEIPRISFLYLSMHRRCLKILFELRGAVQEEFSDISKHVLNADLKNDNLVCTVAGGIIEFGALVDSKDFARPLKYDGGYTNLLSSLSASIMRKVIEKEGSAELNKVSKALA